MSVEAEDRLIAEALGVTLGNIRSLKHVAGNGVVTYDHWERVVTEAHAVASSRLPRPVVPDILTNHPTLDL